MSSCTSVEGNVLLKTGRPLDKKNHVDQWIYIFYQEPFISLLLLVLCTPKHQIMQAASAKQPLGWSVADATSRHGHVVIEACDAFFPSLPNREHRTAAHNQNIAVVYKS